jgi:hypothetical protein
VGFLGFKTTWSGAVGRGRAQRAPASRHVEHAYQLMNSHPGANATSSTTISPRA